MVVVIVVVVMVVKVVVHAVGLLYLTSSNLSLPLRTAELNRVSERLVSIEGQVHSLEERRAAAEAQLHRTQVRNSVTNSVIIMFA